MFCCGCEGEWFMAGNNVKGTTLNKILEVFDGELDG